MERYTEEEKQYLAKLGINIRKTRNTKSMTQLQIAALCNSEKANLSRLECGVKNPTILTLRKIAEALQVPIADFFGSDSHA